MSQKQNPTQPANLVDRMSDYFKSHIQISQEIVNDPEFENLHPSLKLCFKMQVPAAEFAYNAFIRLAKDSGYEIKD